MNNEPKQNQPKASLAELLRATQSKSKADGIVIAVPCSDTSGLAAQVSPGFGHAEAYAFVRVQADGSLTATSEFSPYLDGHTPGQVPAFVALVGAHVALSRSMGKGALALLEKLGIEVRTCDEGTVEEAVRAYLQGSLPKPIPCKGHWQGEGQRCACDHRADG